MPNELLDTQTTQTVKSDHLGSTDTNLNEWWNEASPRRPEDFSHTPEALHHVDKDVVEALGDISAHSVVELKGEKSRLFDTESPAFKEHEFLKSLEAAAQEKDISAIARLIELEAALSEEAVNIIIDMLSNDDFELSIYGNLTDEERTKAFMIQDLTKKLGALTDAESRRIVEKLYAKTKPWFVAGLVNRYEDTTISKQAVIDILEEKGETRLILANIQHLPSIDVKAYIRKAYDEGRVFEVLESSYYLKGQFDQRELLDELIKVHRTAEIVYYLHEFTQLTDADKDKIVEETLKEKRYYNLASRSEYFPNLDCQSLAEQMIEAGDFYGFDNDTFLSKIDTTQVQEALYEHNYHWLVMSHVDRFKDVDVMDCLFKSIDAGHNYNVFEKIKTIPDLDMQLVYDRYINNGNFTPVLENVELFPNVDLKKVVVLAADQDVYAVYGIIRILEQHPEIDRDEIMRRIISAGNGIGFIGWDGQDMSGYPPDQLYQLFIDTNRAADSLALLDKFKGAVLPEKIAADMVVAFEKNIDDMTAMDFSKLSSYIIENVPDVNQPNILRLANRYMKAAGITYSGYRIIESLYNQEDIPEEAKQVGVTATGVKGLEQFGIACRKVASELMDVELSEETVAKINGSSLYKGILEKVYRIDSAQFGALDEEKLNALIAYDMQARADGRIAPMNEAYQPKQDQVLLIDGDAERVELTNDARERYEALYKDVEEAIMLLEHTKQPFSVLLQRLSVKIFDEISSMQGKLENSDTLYKTDKEREFATRNLEAKNHALQELLDQAREGKYIGHDFILNSPADLSKVLPQLEQFPNLHGEMRQLIFAWALRKNPQSIDKMKQLQPEPSVDNIGDMRGFIEQIVNNQTFDSYFSDKKIAQKFKRLTSTQALDDALVRHQQVQASSGQQALEIIPTRSFALELSGHVSDACWADVYESIGEQFPQVTSIMFKRGEKDSPIERLVGSALLIETTDEDGNGVLLLRGLNPIENYINKVKVEDFYRIATEYCREVAAKLQLRPAIVIDTQVALAGTNRPVLQEYAERLKPHLEQIIVDDATTNFNQLDVTHVSYAL
ncbi:MAG: hypothetical protein WAQ27_04940 [Candidatus Microsaccharimonas sp.]